MLQKILRAKLEALSGSLHSVCARAIAIMLDIGIAMMNPASAGFFPASQDENEITEAESRTFMRKVMGLCKRKMIEVKSAVFEVRTFINKIS